MDDEKGVRPQESCNGRAAACTIGLQQVGDASLALEAALEYGRWAKVARRAFSHRRTRSVGHLLGGSAATVAITLVTIALTARALGATEYGVLALILTLAQATERLVSFQSWQPLIRYGATLDRRSDHDAMRSLLKFGLMLDLAGGAAAWVIASLLALAAHWVLGISMHHVALALIYTASLLFGVAGVSTAIFRLQDRFALMARIQVANALIRLVAVAAALIAEADLLAFVIIWAATQVQGTLTSFAAAWIVLRRERAITGVLRAPLSGIAERFPGIWRFTWGSNASLMLWSSTQQLDTLIVGWLASPAAAGLYYLAKRASRIVQQIGSHLEAVVYPELSRMAARGDRAAIKRLVLQTELILAAFGATCFVVLLVLGEPLLRLTAGPDFVAAAPLLSVQILAVLLTLSGAANRAALLALGRQPAVLLTVMMSVGVFYSAAPPLVIMVGPMGANIAHVLFGAVWLAGLTISLRRALRRAEASG